MVDAVDKMIAKRDLDQLPEAKLRPFRLRHRAFGSKYFVGSQIHVCPNANPLARGQRRSFTGRLPPVHVAAVGRGQPHRPEKHDPLAVDRRVERLGNEFAGQLRNQTGSDDVLLPLVPQFDQGEVLAVVGCGWTRTKSCGPGLRTGTVVKSFSTLTVSVKDWLRRRFAGLKGSSWVVVTAAPWVSPSGSGTACGEGLFM